MTENEKMEYIEAAKFFQNLLFENDIPCYLIGGALINSIRDDGNFISEDIDFAVITNESLDFILKILKISGIEFIWESHPSILTIYAHKNGYFRIDFFKFDKFYLNYRINLIKWLHEKIYSFQTFKNEYVYLNGKEFITFFRPDIFLKTVYGDWNKYSDDYFSPKSGDTSHVKECIFYTDEDNYDKIDFQVENLKIIFKSVIVKRNIINLYVDKINVFDDCYLDKINKNKNLMYSDFINYYIKENIKYHNEY